MRVACVYDAFHENNNRSDPYVFASYVSCITAMPSSDKGVEVAKRSVVVTPDGINIGAVGYPYSPDNKELPFKEVKAVKSANTTFRCVRDSDGNVVPVRYDKAAGMYTAPNGEMYRERDIMHKYYNSQTLEAEKKRLAEGQPLQTCQAYVDWMEMNKHNRRILDIGMPAGKDMALCVDEVYFGEYTPSSLVDLPEIYLRTRQVVTYRDNAVQEFILKSARSENTGFFFEYPTYKGVVTKVLKDGDYVYVDYTRAQMKEDPANPGKKIFVATDRIETMEFPNHANQVEILIEPVEYAVDQQIDPDHLLNHFSRLVRTVPFDPTYSNYNAVVNATNEAITQWISKQVITHHSPIIRGVPSIALSFLGELPKGVSERDYFARNRRSIHLFEVMPGALIGNLNPFVKFNLLHHYWFKSFKPNEVLI